MWLEVGCPCTLLLGYAKAADGSLRQVGVALQHPPTHLFATAADTLSVTGPRADVAHAAAARLPYAGQVEVELTTPALMGLASEAMLGLSTARGLAWANQRPAAAVALAGAIDLGPEAALALWAYDQGGALLVAPPIAPGFFPVPLRRHALEHADRAAAWAWVLYLPGLPNDAPLEVETERARALHTAAARLNPATARIVDEALWPALEHDDLTAFGRALTDLRTLNAALLPPLPATPHDQAALAAMAKSGAVAYGRTLTGYGLFALVRGAQAAVALRAALTKALPLNAGRVLVTIADVFGARAVEHARKPALG